MSDISNISVIGTGSLFAYIIITFICHIKDINTDFINLAFTLLIPIFSFLLWNNLMKRKVKNQEMTKLWNIIRVSAITFFKKQFVYFLLFVVPTSLIILPLYSTFCLVNFLMGFFMCSLVGFICLISTSYTSLRVANYADRGLEEESFNTSIMGSTITGLSMIIPIQLFIFFLYFSNKYYLITKFINNASLFTFGAAFSALLTRINGGLFTKSADIGADLVGKLESDIPEDDISNPAVLADNMGDLVGDSIGSVQTMFSVASGILIILQEAFFSKFKIISVALWFLNLINFLPFFGLFFMRILKKTQNTTSKKFIMLCAMNILFLVFCTLLFKAFGMVHLRSFFMGLLSTIFNIIITIFFTNNDFPFIKKRKNEVLPVYQLASISQYGGSFNVLSGISLGKITSAIVLINMCISFFITLCISRIEWYGFDYIIGAISLFPTLMILDNFGPIADNAGGLVEMSGQHNKEEGRRITDQFDIIGNTTKAITKNVIYGVLSIILINFFCTYSRVSLTCLSIIIALASTASIYMFSSLVLNVLLHITKDLVQHIRDHFKKMNSSEKTNNSDNSENHVEIIKELSRITMKKMHIPVVIPILFTYFIVYFIFFVFSYSISYLLVGWLEEQVALTDFIFSITLTMKIFIAITGIAKGIEMSTSGGAWDNCKKLIESGFHGGKNSPTHKNAVVGDTVGDAYKDVVGPAMAPLVLTMFFFIDLGGKFARIFINF